jgi:hypothetical protein
MGIWRNSVPITNLRQEMIIKGSLVNPDDGDLKLSVTPSGDTVVMEYIAGAEQWIPATFKVGSASLEVGPQVTISDAGNLQAYTLNYLPGEFRLHPYYTFGEGGTVREIVCPRMIGPAGLAIDLHDGSTDHPGLLNGGGKYKTTSSNAFSINFLIWKQAFRVGDTIPTAPLIIRAYVGSEAVENLATEMILPVSFWDGKVAGDIVEFYFSSKFEGSKTPLAGEAYQTYYTTFESDEPWSLYGDETQAFGRITGQLYTFDRLVTDNTVEVSGTVTHEVLSTYIVDTSGGECEITVPHGTEAPFTVRDQKKTFNVGSKGCKIYIKDSGGSTIHSATLNNYNKSYHLYFDGAYWNYSIEGEGETVSIASEHISAVDFPYEPQLADIDLPAIETNAGKVRYQETENSSCMGMCMKTGDSTYEWVCFQVNTW